MIDEQPAEPKREKPRDARFETTIRVDGGTHDEIQKKLERAIGRRSRRRLGRKGRKESRKSR